MRVCWGNLLVSSLDMRHLSREPPKYKVSLLMDNESEHCLWYSCLMQQCNWNIAITCVHDLWCMMRPLNGNVVNPRFVWWWLVEQSSVYDTWCLMRPLGMATDDLMWSLSGSIANPSSKQEYCKPIKQADANWVWKCWRESINAK